MVAVIKAGHSINRILNYNEQKVKEGVATLLGAENYPMEAEQLSFQCKLNRLLKQAALNDNVSQKSVHISLNFDPSERLSAPRLKDIATTYMQQIGFGEQPYLVYEHFDAGHPHIHIVSIKVKADGSRIDMHNIGKNKSEPARKEIEKTHGLVSAEDSRKKQLYRLKPVNVQQVRYCRMETKRAITNVLDAVLNTYKYSSLPELNAVLGLYNIMADKGSERSRVFQHHGLLYRLIDEDGKKVGVPIKASNFYQKPTLSFLESRFQQNEKERQPHKARVKNTIDLAFLKQTKPSIETLIDTLKKEGINAIVRQNAEGTIYGLTYVDHRTKCVFNGSDLGKQYSAKGISERCGAGGHLPSERHATRLAFELNKSAHLERPSISSDQLTSHKSSANENLLQPDKQLNFVPGQFKKKRKKKRLNKNL